MRGVGVNLGSAGSPPSTRTRRPRRVSTRSAPSSRCPEASERRLFARSKAVPFAASDAGPVAGAAFRADATSAAGVDVERRLAIGTGRGVVIVLQVGCAQAP